MNKIELTPTTIKLFVLVLVAVTLLFAIAATLQLQALDIKQQGLREIQSKLRAELSFLEQGLNEPGPDNTSPRAVNSAQVYDFFSSCANRSGMSVVKLAVKPGTDSQQLLLDFTADGNYSRLLLFMRYLTQSQYNLSIKNLELQAISQKNDTSLRLFMKAAMPLARGV